MAPDTVRRRCAVRACSILISGLAALVAAACGSDTTMLPTPTVGAQGVSIVRVEINQGVAAVLVKNSMPSKKGKHAPPVVGSRAALIRGYWKLGMGSQSRAVLGILTVIQADGSMRQFRDMKMVKERSKALDSGSVPRDEAFNWKLEPANVRSGMQFSIELYEGAAAADAAPMPAPRLPETGTIPIKVDDAAVELDVVVLPVTLKGSTPAATPQNVKALRDFLYDIYPVQKVNMEVRTAMEIRGLAAASKDKTAFKEAIFPALTKICMADRAPPGVLYQAIVDRSKTGLTHGGTARGRSTPWGTRCNKIAFNLGGYSYTPSSGFAKGMKIDYPNAIDAKADSVAHEYGHLYGRPHIDCGGPSGVEPKFPYKNGSLGQQGYRLRADTFMHMNAFHDFMGYCRLRWISDWSLKTLHPDLKMVTKLVSSTPELEANRRSLMTYVGVHRFHAAHRWMEVDGDATEPNGLMQDSYAQVWVNGRVSERLAVTALADEEGDVERVAFVLPDGLRAPERAVVVHRGVRVEIVPSMVESL